ncbi:hypothetical protein LH991_08095 [Schleiferilactobacillus harbinensis]|nr:hypothetical protein [Schleiferilactobacillus harbinensis]MCT2908501.1 hypothetical protein [Schleiferilactobacillus harbinensis]QFR63943.1 hypothetical protein LH991_08095 [Schleiferilactobacillus harbinensis]
MKITRMISCIFVDVIAIGFLPSSTPLQFVISFIYVFLIPVGILTMFDLHNVLNGVNKHNMWRVIVIIVLMLPMLAKTLAWQNSILSITVNVLMALAIMLGAICLGVYGIKFTPPAS